jgi:hypothetical protein
VLELRPLVPFLAAETFDELPSACFVQRISGARLAGSAT